MFYHKDGTGACNIATTIPPAWPRPRWGQRDPLVRTEWCVLVMGICLDCLDLIVLQWCPSLYCNPLHDRSLAISGDQTHAIMHTCSCAPIPASGYRIISARASSRSAPYITLQHAQHPDLPTSAHPSCCVDPWLNLDLTCSAPSNGRQLYSQWSSPIMHPVSFVPSGSKYVVSSGAPWSLTGRA